MRTFLHISLCILIVFILFSCSEDDNSVTLSQNPDPTIPIVKILSPTESDELIDSVNVNISATDDKGIVKVEFILNNQVIKSWTNPPYKFLWDLSSFNDSTAVSFFAKAYDADNNIATTKVYYMIAWRLNVPTNLTMEPVSNTSVNLEWNDNSAIETGYVIEQQVNSGNFSELVILNANTTNYIVNNLDILNEYSFRIKAIRNNYSSNYTPEVSIRFDYNMTFFKTLSGHSGLVRSVAFSPDGNFIVSGAQDNKIKLWNPSTGNNIYTISGHTDLVNSVIFSPDGNYIASGSDDSTIKLWETSSGNLIRTFNGHSNDVRSVDFSPDGSYIVSGSFDNTVKLWETLTGSLIRTFSGHTFVVLSVAFSPDGYYIVSGSSDKTVKLWETSTGSLIRTLSGHTGYVSSTNFSPDGNYIASGSYDNAIKLWETSTGNLIRTLSGHTSSVYSIAFRSDGNYIASGSGDNTVKLWELSTGSFISDKLNSFSVQTVAFSHDGNYMANNSGNDINDIILWQVNENWIKILE